MVYSAKREHQNVKIESAVKEGEAVEEGEGVEERGGGPCLINKGESPWYNFGTLVSAQSFPVLGPRPNQLGWKVDLETETELDFLTELDSRFSRN